MNRIILSIFLLSVFVFATPATYNNTGLVTKLEKFAPTCSYYSSITKKDLGIKSLCRKYEKNLNVALKLGYKIDKSTSNNSSLLEKYLSKLLSLDEVYRQIIEKVLIEKTKARESNDAIYHEKIIREDVISLYKSDYEFVATHRDVYIKANNQRYLKMVKDRREEFLSKEERILVVQKQKEAKDRQKREEHQAGLELEILKQEKKNLVTELGAITSHGGCLPIEMDIVQKLSKHEYGIYVINPFTNTRYKSIVKLYTIGTEYTSTGRATVNVSTDIKSETVTYKSGGKGFVVVYDECTPDDAAQTKSKLERKQRLIWKKANLSKKIKDMERKN